MDLLNPTIICTSFEDLPLMINYPIKSTRILYLYELDWNKNFDFQQSKKFIDLFPKIFCKNDYDAKIVSEYWRKDTQVIENFNLKELINANSK